MQCGMATNRTWKDQTGQKREEVVFVDIEAWGKSAEILHKYLVKGKRIAIQGRLQLDQWVDKASGQKRSKHKLVVDSFTFIDSAPKDVAPATGQQAHDDGPPLATEPPDIPFDVPADQIPI